MVKFIFRQNATPRLLSSHPQKVVIMANNFKEANELAEKQGIYFDGVISGIDCPCCGDRWRRMDEEDELEEDDESL
jgi:hypothetical protein